MEELSKRVTPPREELQAGSSGDIPEVMTASCLMLPLKTFQWDKTWR